MKIVERPDGWYVDQGKGHLDGPHESEEQAVCVKEAMIFANEFLGSCYFCETEFNSDDLDAIVEAGWIPSFWDGGEETDHPVCPTCTAEELDYVNGEWQLREPHTGDDGGPCWCPKSDDHKLESVE